MNTPTPSHNAIIKTKARHTHFDVPRLLVLSFAGAITAGAMLLLLPPMMADGKPRLAVVDAFFTSCSAVCVTGLGVRDIGSDFSLVGQVVILLLIQIGGLGILTCSNVLVLARRGRVDMEGRLLIEETHGTLPYISPAKLMRFILLYTFSLEALGAVLLTARFSADFSFPKALWMGVFHSVSAFCNAGFGLLSSSLMDYHDDVLVNLVIMGLIICGGIGFIVLADLSYVLSNLRRKGRRMLSFHSRIVLRTTSVLIFGGAVAIFFLEIPGHGMPGPWYVHGMESFFLSVTARTAGFNTVDIGALGNGTLMAVILLMFIGGSPGSAAGGIKTTTAATLYALIRSHSRNRPKVELLDRSISPEIIAKALLGASFFTIAIALAVLTLEITELEGQTVASTRSSFLPHLFEVVSAIGTVGLSTGITASLTAAGKTVLIACMFIGRLGPIIIAVSIIGSQRRLNYTYPEEPFIVG